MSFSRGPQMPNPEGEREWELSKATPAEFAELETDKALRRRSYVARHPRLAKLFRIRLEPQAENAPPDEDALKEVAAKLQAEYPHQEP